MKTFMLYLNSDFEVCIRTTNAHGSAQTQTSHPSARSVCCVQGGSTNFLANTQALFKDETGIFRAQVRVVSTLTAGVCSLTHADGLYAGGEHPAPAQARAWHGVGV
jgi:hypothetical protein